MSDFKSRYFGGEMIRGSVRSYCKYGFSYRDLEELLLERGVDADHMTATVGLSITRRNRSGCGGNENLPRLQGRGMKST